MREIKFRLWDKKYHVFDECGAPDMFISINGEIYEKEERTYAMQSYTEYEKADHYELSQYTGLKDKNGKEIYEGDVVSAFHGTQLSAVTWNKEFGLYEVVLQVSGLSASTEELLGNHLDVIEVIGNIYENPELITAEPEEEKFSKGNVVKHKDAAYSEEFTIVRIEDEGHVLIQGPESKYKAPFYTDMEKLIKVNQ